MQKSAFQGYFLSPVSLNIFSIFKEYLLFPEAEPDSGFQVFASSLQPSISTSDHDFASIPPCKALLHAF
jgi:hypothetical protein